MHKDTEAGPHHCNQREMGQVTFYVNLEESKRNLHFIFQLNYSTRRSDALCSWNAKFCSGGL